MSPKDYIQARESLQSQGQEVTDSVLIDGQPYYPNFNVDTNDLESIRKVVTIRFASEAGEGGRDASTTNGQKWPVSVVSGGITNQLYRVECNSDGHNNDNKKFSILVRIFGAHGLINRDVENSTYATLASQNLAPKYYGRFANGRLEEYLDGMIPLKPQQMSEPALSKAIAQRLAIFHTQFTIPESLKEYHNTQTTQQPSMWTDLDNWMESALKATFQTPHDTERSQRLDLTKILPELDWLRQHVVPTKTAAVGFCHNDLLAANILYCPPTKANGNTNGNAQSDCDGEMVDVDVRLIDFEYGGINYYAFDIANHFNEYAGGTDDGITNYDWFPTKQQQLTFLRTYLQGATANADVSSEVEVEKWYHLIQPFILANHLYWGLWAVNQASTEGCNDFDYLLYATNRINRYYECKKIWKEQEEKEH